MADPFRQEDFPYTDPFTPGANVSLRDITNEPVRNRLTFSEIINHALKMLPGEATKGRKKKHEELATLRDQPGADQEAIAPSEHGAFAREWMKENPGIAFPSLLAGIPAWQMAKLLGLVNSRTPASLDQMAEGYRGLWEGMK